jgi:trehalose synthase
MMRARNHRPGLISFDEQFYPARPRSFRRRQARPRITADEVQRLGPPRGDNLRYVNWLRRRSMLRSARATARHYSGTAAMWQNPFSIPRPRAAVRAASVWFTAYPLSLITRPGESYLRTLGDEALWKVFAQIGINAIHTGPVKEAGGLRGWQRTRSVDGHFDRISNSIDDVFGTEREFRRMVATAAQHGATVIDDIVPGHTGKGPDFRLAEMKVRDYPGIYHMVEIQPEDWRLLPDVPARRDSVNLTSEAEARLEKAGYIVGRLQRVIFYEPGVKETNWSATRPVRGPDKVERRWVYLHYFKDGQPSINWLDPSCAGIRLVIGDALHSLGDLGSGGLRLDANGFLGVEKGTADRPAWSEGHPLSEAANQLISNMVRKVGGFTFQELNLTVDDIRSSSETGPDLSYDFITRPAYHHALVTGDTEFLRLMLSESLQLGVDPAALVHGLQNHDELTYELIHLWSLHRADTYRFRGADVTGERLRDIIRTELAEALTGDDHPYNLLFTTNGIACTTATVAAAALGYRDLEALTDRDIARIQQVHLLLAMYNAWQPGVFALSGWDLCGTLTLDPDKVAPLLADGDTRWINRGAHDLLDFAPGTMRSAAGIPRGRSLYGSICDQLGRADSFASRLRGILAVRAKYGIATARQLDVPEVPARSLLVMVHHLAGDRFQVTALNFGAEPVAGRVRSEVLPFGAVVTDMSSGEQIGDIDNLGAFGVALSAYQGMALNVSPPEPTTSG